jgi:hypothetical protein
MIQKQLMLMLTFQAYGVSYAASEELSVSVNMSTHDYENATLSDQEALGISVSYVMGSMTLKLTTTL